MGKVAFPGDFKQRTKVGLRGPADKVHVTKKARGSPFSVSTTKKIHPDYDAAKAWCLGPNVQGKFMGRRAGNFDFEDAQDAMAFKLTWG